MDYNNALNSVPKVSIYLSSGRGALLYLRRFLPSLVPMVPTNRRGGRAPEAGSMYFRVKERAAAAAVVAGPSCASFCGGGCGSGGECRGAAGEAHGSGYVRAAVSWVSERSDRRAAPGAARFV